MRGSWGLGFRLFGVFAYEYKEEKTFALLLKHTAPVLVASLSEDAEA